MQPYCIPCDKLHQAEWYARNREVHKRRARQHRLRVTTENTERILQYLKAHPCVDCGESDPVVLQFDHVRGVKTNAVKAMILAGRAWEVIEEEIAKCEVRCGNCHVRKTAKQFGWRILDLIQETTSEPVG